MHVFAAIRHHIIAILQRLQQQGALPQEASFDAVTAEPPRDASHGDIATNAAMVIAKVAKKPPRHLAELIAEQLKNLDEIENVEVAGPGFINMSLYPHVWHSQIAVMLKEGKHYGNTTIGNGEKVNVEYVSANPTGPMHIGHARGAVYGDALAMLLQKAGFAVTKEYYINDAGAQVDVLACSAFLRYKQALGHEIGAIPEGLYPGDYLVAVGERLADTFGDRLLDQEDAQWLPCVKEVALEAMMQLIKDDLRDLGVVHDVFSSEKALQDNQKIEEALDYLDEKGLLYQGVLEPPKGKKPDDWEPRKQTLFKATEYGDDVDRPLKKSDGSFTYFAADIAYHLDKYRRGFNDMVLVLGADHGGYVKRLKAAVNALSDGTAKVDCKISQLVNYLEDGQPVKMSKRAGTFTTVRDVINAVGKDIIRFIMLTRKNDVVLDFDLKAVQDQSKDNPIFYVQYAHARATSVLLAAKKEASEAYAMYENNTNHYAKLSSKDELALIKRMASWPRVVEAAALAHEPHRIAFYLQELAGEFHSLWNKGKEEAVLRFIIPDDAELTAARLAMLEALRTLIASALAIFNIEAMDEMR